MPELNLNIRLSQCYCHSDLVNLLSPLFYAEAGDTVIVNLDIKGFVVPDYLLLVVSALKKVEEKGILPSGIITYSDSTVGYASRMNFFQNLNASFGQHFARQDPHNRFVEITNFDSQNDHLLADRVINMLHAYGGIDVTVLQGVSFCIGEIIGNIHFHAESYNGGWVVAQYYPKTNKIRLLVCDTGVGIHSSLTKNPLYNNLDEIECLRQSIVNGVTSGVGMGFGLYAISSFVNLNRGKLLIHSGEHCLEIGPNIESVSPCSKWQGTFIFWEINTNIIVEPGSFTNGYTTYVDDYEEKYGGTDFDINNLW